jgi:hypothetical protein
MFFFPLSCSFSAHSSCILHTLAHTHTHEFHTWAERTKWKRGWFLYFNIGILTLFASLCVFVFFFVLLFVFLIILWPRLLIISGHTFCINPDFIISSILQMAYHKRCWRYCLTTTTTTTMMMMICYSHDDESHLLLPLLFILLFML